MGNKAARSAAVSIGLRSEKVGHRVARGAQVAGLRTAMVAGRVGPMGASGRHVVVCVGLAGPSIVGAEALVGAGVKLGAVGRYGGQVATMRAVSSCVVVPLWRGGGRTWLEAGSAGRRRRPLGREVSAELECREA